MQPNNFPEDFRNTEMGELQEQVYTYLLSKNVRFTVNTNIEDLKKGVWFSTSENYFYFSFWETSSLPIIFSINDGEPELVIYNFKKTDENALFINKISSILNSSKNNKANIFFSKKYPKINNKNIKEILDTITDSEKEIIDNLIKITKFINNIEIEIDFINQKYFEKNIAVIQNIRNNFIKNNTPSKNNAANKNKNKFITLKSVKIFNITCFVELNLEFGKRATVILGENGTGKTSILRAILLGLVGNNPISRKNSKITYLLKTETPNSKKKFKENTFIDITSNLYPSQKIGLRYVEVQQYTEVLNNDSLQTENHYIFDDMYFKQLILAFPQIQTHSFIGNISDIHPPIAYELQPNVNDIRALLYNQPLDCLRELASWISRLDADARGTSVEDKNKKIVLNKLFATLSGVIGMPIRLHKTEHTRDQIWVEVGEGSNMEISLFGLLSQGFKNVFAWVGHIVRRMAESKDYAPDFNEQAAIILIDEIDTYLHPKWQRTILKTLLDNFPNTQFIISTHSPLVANYIPPTTVSSEDMRVYVLEVDSPEPRRLDKVYGQDIKTIFAELGVAERPKPVYNLIHQIFELIDSEIAENIQKANKLLNELINLIGDKDPIIVQIQTAIDLANWGLNSDDSDLNSLNNI